MAFQPNRPERFDKLNDSQAHIQTNFESVNDSFNVNHFSFDEPDSNKRGKHKNLTIVQTEDTGGDQGFEHPGADDTEVLVYSREIGENRVQAYISYQADGNTMPLSPFASCIIERTQEPTLKEGSMNIESVTLGTTGATVKFKTEHDRNDYMVFLQVGDQSQGDAEKTQLNVTNQKKDSFRVQYTRAGAQGDYRMYVRVY